MYGVHSTSSRYAISSLLSRYCKSYELVLVARAMTSLKNIGTVVLDFIIQGSIWWFGAGAIEVCADQFKSSQFSSR